MASVEIIEARLEALDKAIASGVLTVRHGDTQTTYRSMSDLLTARAHVAQQLDAAAGTKPTRVRKAYQSGKGL